MNEMVLQYRPLSHVDLPFRLKWLNDPETNQYLGTRVRQGTDLAFHKKWFAAYQQDPSREIFTVLDGETPIGQVGLVAINTDDKNAELYIVIGEASYRGRGLSKELVQYILEYGYATLGLHRIWLTVQAANVPAIRCYESCGFVQEGLLRESVLRNGEYEDEIIMGRLHATYS